MGVQQPSTPRRAPARATAVASFYATLAVLGFFWHAVSQGSNDVLGLASSSSWRYLVLGPLFGLLMGLTIVQLFRALELRMTWLGELHHEFRSILGQPGPGELVLLAAASAFGEEVFFRGAMLDDCGVWVSSIVFALIHISPRASLWPWTASAFALGLALASITLVTGNLAAALVAHFVINLQNLAYITRHQPRIALRGPIRPQPP